MNRRKLRDNASPFSPSPWSGVVYRLSKQWKVPVLVFSLGAFQSALAFQDASTPASDATPTLGTSLEESLKVADRLLGNTVLPGTGTNELTELENRNLVNSVERLALDNNRTAALIKISNMFNRRKEFSSAREAALKIDQTQLFQKTSALISVARAEQAADQNENAWLTLKEAQTHAMKLGNAEQLIALMREIGTVERKLRADAAAAAHAKPGGAATPDETDDSKTLPAKSADVQKPERLQPEPEKVINEVLKHGLPPVAYEEVELLNEGGGPGREPRSIYHSYYYNGDRIFQGPMFPGGPTDVHVIHPRTGDRCVFRVNMPTGTPFIEYEKSSIEYYFPDIVVELNFRRSGGYDIDYRTLFNKYDREHRKARDRRLRATESAFGIDPADVGDRLLKLGQSGPLSLTSRLPFLSNLLDRNSKRVPGTLDAQK